MAKKGQTVRLQTELSSDEEWQKNLQRPELLDSSVSPPMHHRVLPHPLDIDRFPRLSTSSPSSHSETSLSPPMNHGLVMSHFVNSERPHQSPSVASAVHQSLQHSLVVPVQPTPPVSTPTISIDKPKLFKPYNSE
ncbi:hypothetical protein WA026_023024 [Henosepilachna vigintioctopunctata]|uniref:Uncharacterized protein n=1 Tax=Henosepilachna vigintioctopunctata TaxID=420089 RepID=A0AAW1VJD9_9CUCU